MKYYLTNFLKLLEFEKEDSEFLLKVYDKIAENSQTNEIWNNALLTYENDLNCDFNALLMLADKVANILYLHEYTTEFLLCLCLTKRLKKEYESRGIDDEIFINTMLDFRYKLEECKLVKGIIGSFVAYWYGDFFKLKCFGLGRLQFQLTQLGSEYQIDDIVLKPGTKALSVHIPRTKTPLDPESCNKAFTMAKSFFKDEIGDMCIFTCHSWLLYRENFNILSKNSNIYKFMSRFFLIYSTSDKDCRDLWRLFDTDEKNPDRLPNNTSLRRAYIEHLKKGGKLGSGFGVYILV